MREIKFRVFDDISKTIYQWNKICNIPIIDFKLEHYKLMQYTGLKDKKGKDIYEGDILKSMGTDICVVRYIDKLACFMMENTNPIDDYDFILNPLHKGYEYREVIGNIYVNPI